MPHFPWIASRYRNGNPIFKAAKAIEQGHRMPSRDRLELGTLLDRLDRYIALMPEAPIFRGRPKDVVIAEVEAQIRALWETLE